MVCASFRLVPSKTLQCFHGYAPRQISGKTKDEEKVLIIGHKRSIEGFEEQLLPWLRKRVDEIKRAVFFTLTLLRAATTKEFDTIARLETQAMHTTMHTTTVEMTHDFEGVPQRVCSLWQRRLLKGTPEPCREDSGHFGGRSRERGGG